MSLLLAGILAMLTLGVLLVVSERAKDPVRVSRVWLWGGLVSPMFVQVGRDLSEVEQLSFGIADVLRAGLPIAALTAGLILARPVRRGIGIAEILLALFCLWCLTTTLWSVHPLATFLKTIVLAVEFALMAALARRYDDGASMLRSIVGAAHVLVISVFVGLAVSPSQAFPATLSGIHRLTGVYPIISPNVLGLIILVAVLGFVCRVGPAWATNRMRWPLLVLELIAIVGARSRLALLVLVVAVCFVWSRSLFRLRRRALGIIAVAMSGSIVLLFFQETLTAFLGRGQTDSQLGSLTGRLPLWQNALETWHGREFLGFGYYAGHRLAVSPVSGSGISSNLDNMWVELLVDVGIVGTAIMAFAICAGAIRLVRSHDDPDVQDFRLAACLSFFAATFFNPSLQIVAFIGLFFGLLLYADQPTGEPTREVLNDDADSVRMKSRGAA